MREVTAVDYSVEVEKDDQKPSMFKVVIKQGNTVVGVPLRGVTEEKATEMKPNLVYAFRYGLDAGRDLAIDAIHRYWPGVKW